MKAHDIQYKKRKDVSGKQLGEQDDDFWFEFDAVAAFGGLTLIVLGVILLIALYGHTRASAAGVTESGVQRTAGTTITRSL